MEQQLLGETPQQSDTATATASKKRSKSKKKKNSTATSNATTESTASTDTAVTPQTGMDTVSEPSTVIPDAKTHNPATMNQQSTGATPRDPTRLTNQESELTAVLTAQGLQQYLSALSTAESLTIADLIRLTISDYATMGIAAGPAFKIQRALLNASQQSHNNQQQTSTTIASHVGVVGYNGGQNRNTGLRHHTPTTATATTITATTATATATASTTATVATRTDDADGMCKVCWEREIDAMTIPCRHLKFCAECMIQPGTEGLPTMKECPYCRAEITSVMKINM